MGLFRKNGKQRMGNGVRSCHNMNAWAHLFSPNSPSALEGEINCDIHHARTGVPEGTPDAGFDTTDTVGSPVIKGNNLTNKVGLVGIRVHKKSM